MVASQLFGGKKSTVALRSKLLECFAASEELIMSAVENFESQPERTLKARLVLTHQLLKIVDELLSYEDWGMSPFINQLLKPTREMQAQLQSFLSENESGKQMVEDSLLECPTGYKEAYLLMYQLQGDDLAGWICQLQDLSTMAISRPLYSSREAVERCIRLRGYMPTDAYAVLYLPTDYLYDETDEKKDKWGQPLMQFRKSQLPPEMVKQFKYQNQEYRLEDGLLRKMNSNSSKTSEGRDGR